jgi:hypothetical protein
LVGYLCFNGWISDFDLPSRKPPFIKSLKGSLILVGRRMYARNKKLMAGVLTTVIVAVSLVYAGQVQGQQVEELSADLPDPKGALLRSAVMPGWGHYYVNNQDWTRGKYHLAAEVALLTAFVGLRLRSGFLETNLITYARKKAGTDLENRDRQYWLAIGNFDNREAYNDYNQKTRNWDRLYPDEERYRWDWPSKEARLEYKSLQNRIDKIDRQLPALASLMVVNRVVSGISSFLQARDVIDQAPKIGMAPNRSGGMSTRIQIPF